MSRYKCDSCGNSFIWKNGESCYWGKIEYGSKKEEEEDAKYFCDKKCYKNR